MSHDLMTGAIPFRHHLLHKRLINTTLHYTTLHFYNGTFLYITQNDGTQFTVKAPPTLRKRDPYCWVLYSGKIVRFSFSELPFSFQTYLKATIQVQ